VPLLQEGLLGYAAEMAVAEGTVEAQYYRAAHCRKTIESLIFSARYDGTATEHAHPSRSTATELVAHLEHEGKERGSSTSCEPGADCENAALQCYRASDGIHVSRALLQKSVHSCRNVFNKFLRYVFGNDRRYIWHSVACA
jgi:hypothetical protein